MRLFAIAGASAVAIFLETESGIVMMVTAPLVLFLIYPWRLFIVLPVVGFFVVTLAVLMVILIAVFGTGVLDATFIQRQLDGILFYGGTGFSGVPIMWTLTEWNWFYRLVAPGSALATIGVIARACGNVELDRKRAAVLGFLAVSGLLLLVKSANQSLTAVWQMSAIGPLSVVGWWCLALVKRIDPSLFRRRVFFGVNRETADGKPLRPLVEYTVSLRRGVATAMIALVLFFLISPSEARNPGLYGLRAWLTYPSLVRRMAGRPQGCVRMECAMPNFPADSDVALITSLTRPGEQVAIIVDLYDWAYLVKARRPPLMYFVPSAIMFSQRQLQESLRRIATQRYIFIAKSPDGDPFNPYPVTEDFRAAIEPMLGTTFQKVGEGNRLVAWKRIAD
jgi:hypothetical protein